MMRGSIRKSFLLDYQDWRLPLLSLASAGAADLVGVVVRVAGVDAQPVIHRVRAGVRMGARSLPLRVGQRLEQLEAGGAYAGEDGEGRFDRRS